MSNNLPVLPQKEIESRIFTFRTLQVMIDRDLAEIYGVETKVLNQAIKRNLERFPDTFRFQLTDSETLELVTICDRFKNIKHSSSNPYAFTEQGIAMLSAVLRSETAINVSIQIIHAFVEMRKIIVNNATLFHRLDKIELKQIETEQKFELIFSAIENKQLEPEKGIFFEGEMFDAHLFISGIVKKAKNSIILIDNYVDETVLTLFSKRNENVEATIFTKQINNQLKLDLKKHNDQYPEIVINILADCHDRFLIIDNEELYHIGASIKDLGKKWCAFSKMNSILPEILKKL